MLPTYKMVRPWSYTALPDRITGIRLPQIKYMDKPAMGCLRFRNLSPSKAENIMMSTTASRAKHARSIAGCNMGNSFE